MKKNMSSIQKNLTVGKKKVFKQIKFNIPELRVGSAVNSRGPTGCTVFHFDECRAHAVADIRGGAVASRETTLLGELSESNSIDALVFSGGSTYGLAAADGVMQCLLKMRKKSVKFADIPCVPAAVIYDFSVRKNSLFPDAKLGEIAFKRAKRNSIEIGRVGAGVSASVGKFFGQKEAKPGGQGAAYFEKENATFFAFSVVNALGNILDLNGKIISGSEENVFDRIISKKKLSEPQKGNTTISLALTNIDFDRNELQRIAAMAHTAMARVIDPFHTSYDGDILFVVSTRKIAKNKTAITENEAGVILGKLLQNAVISAVTVSE